MKQGLSAVGDTFSFSSPYRIIAQNYLSKQIRKNCLRFQRFILLFLNSVVLLSFIKDKKAQKTRAISKILKE